jgi:hypothetical protein
MTNNRTTIYLLIGAFLLLIGVGILQTMRDMPQAIVPPADSATVDPLQALRANPKRIFTDFEHSDIQALSILDPYTGATFSVVSTSNNQWESPEFGQIVTPEIAEQLTFSVAVLPALQTLEQITPAYYPDFGLTEADAYLVISLVLKNGTQHGMVIGDVTTDSLGHYTLVDDRETLYVLDARPIAFIVQILRTVYGDTDNPETTETPTG